MSATTSADIDLREQIVRIDRNIAETQKLFAEAAKMQRERMFIPVSLTIAAVGAGAALFAAAIAFLRFTAG